MKTAHLADNEKPLTTLCGLPWEDWQDPTIPTDAEIGFDSLPYDARVEIRRTDEARRPRPGESIAQCAACWKAATR